MPGSNRSDGDPGLQSFADRVDAPAMVENDTPLWSGNEPLIGIRDLAAWLGVSEHAVRKWVQAGPASGTVPRMLRVNGQIRFRPSDVRAWLDTKAVA
jgi:predicted DNA-binding transcriptional regulator AlpA